MGYCRVEWHRECHFVAREADVRAHFFGDKVLHFQPFFLADWLNPSFHDEFDMHRDTVVLHAERVRSVYEIAHVFWQFYSTDLCFCCPDDVLLIDEDFTSFQLAFALHFFHEA